MTPQVDDILRQLQLLPREQQLEIMEQVVDSLEADTPQPHSPEQKAEFADWRRSIAERKARWNL